MAFLMSTYRLRRKRAQKAGSGALPQVAGLKFPVAKYGQHLLDCKTFVGRLNRMTSGPPKHFVQVLPQEGILLKMQAGVVGRQNSLISWNQSVEIHWPSRGTGTVTPCYKGDFVREFILSVVAVVRIFCQSRSDTALEVLAFDNRLPCSNASVRVQY
jgi:hypothetical protein